MNFRRGIVFALLMQVLIVGVDKGGGLIRYLICLPMPPVPDRALPPAVNQQVLEKFMPEAKAAFDRVNAGEKLEAVSQAIAPKLGMTPGQVALCMITIARPARSREGA